MFNIIIYPNRIVRIFEFFHRCEIFFCFFCDFLQILKILAVTYFGIPKLLTLKSLRKDIWHENDSLWALPISDKLSDLAQINGLKILIWISNVDISKVFILNFISCKKDDIWGLLFGKCCLQHCCCWCDRGVPTAANTPAVAGDPDDVAAHNVPVAVDSALADVITYCCRLRFMFQLLS